MDKTSWQTETSTATAFAVLRFENNCQSQYLASELKIELKLYEDGILRLIIDEIIDFEKSNSYKTRYNISKEDGIGLRKDFNEHVKPDQSVIYEENDKGYTIKSDKHK